MNLNEYAQSKKTTLPALGKKWGFSDIISLYQDQLYGTNPVCLFEREFVHRMSKGKIDSEKDWISKCEF